MNVVMLIGNLATDVELREVAEEKKVATFLLAVNRPRRETADFIRISTWDRQAEVCAEFLGKGSRVGIEGRVNSRSWDDEDGKRRTAVEVVANRVEFLSPRPEAGASAPAEVVPFETAAAS